MIARGDSLSLLIEKPAAGGWMLARHEGRVVLVSGAIPGERVSVKVERIGKGVVYARTAAVDIPSPDRREPFVDPLCGGSLYAHISYERQLLIKAEVIRDGFLRIGRLRPQDDLVVADSREDGYRMRAKVHVRDGRVGFFREGSHDLCDVGATRQLLPACCDALERLGASLRSLGLGASAQIEVSENIEASQRAVHVETSAPLHPKRLFGLWPFEGTTGLSIGSAGRVACAWGDPMVHDALAMGEHAVVLSRHTLSFFQGNRYLLTDLIGRVVADIEGGASVVDLYAGVGLFAVGAAVMRDARVTAVEGDRMAALDLERNVRTAARNIRPVHQPVEVFLQSPRPSPDVVIVDPPRTGMSRGALDGAVALAAPTIVYVSCDVATLARDARRLVDAGYLLRRVDAFDLFPNTPHVETVVVFESTRPRRAALV